MTSQAAIVAVGSELLAPGKRDTNSEFLAERLSELGVTICFKATVGDDPDQIAQSVSQALLHSRFVFLTGGLGPTSDDVTRAGVARALDLDLVLDDSVLRQIEARFRARGRSMPSVNERQAMRLVGSEVLPNAIGTAPGLWVAAAGSPQPKYVVLLPGPPKEMQRLFEDSVVARLEGVAPGKVYLRHSLRVVGLFESAIEEKIGELYRDCANPVTAVLASRGQVEIRLTACAASTQEATDLNETLAAAIRERLGRNVFTESDQTLEQVVGELLTTAGRTLSVAESLTGGLVMHRLTAVSGSSRYFAEGVVTYSNESKSERLGVDPTLIASKGAVSDDVARTMAHGVRKRSGADMGLALTGIAGPGGATPTKPVGLVYVALDGPSGMLSQRHQFPGDREQVKRFSSQAALDLVRRNLLEGSV